MVHEDSLVEEVQTPKKKPSKKTPKEDGSNETRHGAFHGPLNKKLYSAKVGFVYLEIASLGGVEPETGITPKRHLRNIVLNMEYRLHFFMRRLNINIVRNGRRWNFQTLKQRDRKKVQEIQVIGSSSFDSAQTEKSRKMNEKEVKRSSYTSTKNLASRTSSKSIARANELIIEAFKSQDKVKMKLS
nr:hypothetical protein [Tanacetum cinerariifolium]